MNWRSVSPHIGDNGRLAVGHVAKLVKMQAGQLRAHIAADIASASAGADLMEEDGEFFLNEAQALTLVQKFVPRREACRIAIVLAFVAWRMKRAGHDERELDGFGRTLTHMTTTPLGLAALRCEAEKVLASA